MAEGFNEDRYMKSILLTILLILSAVGGFSQAPASMFAVSVKGKQGLIDSVGNMVVEPRFEVVEISRMVWPP